MPLFQLTVLALVQGITEFLPISSSGHLAALPHLMTWPDQGLAIDVAVHAGTLLAVLVYLRHEVVGMIAGLAGRSTPGLRLGLLVILASIPVTAAGFLVLRHLGDVFRSIEVIAWTTLVFGILLGIADRSGAKSRGIDAMTWRDALLVGAAQVLALVPGTSRSGITMTAGLFLGYGRADAARFSLLLGIPAIAGAALLTGIDLYRHGDVALGLDAAFAGGLAFVSALLVVHLMMAWLARASFAPFVAYRVLLGLGLIGWVYL